MSSLYKDDPGSSGHEHEAMCGYCRAVITEPALNGGALVHMIEEHGHALPLEVYRGEDMDGSEGRWTALARKPEGYE